MSVSSAPLDRLDDPIRRPRRLAVAELVAVAAITVGAVVAWSPVVGLAIAGLVLVGWFAWPRWLHSDIDYYAAGVLITAVLFGIPRQVDVGGASLGGALSALLVAVAVLLLIHRTGRIDRAWRAMWPLVGFLAWSWFSLRVAATLEGLQNVVVFTGFIVIATLAYARTLEDPSFTERLEKLFERTFWLLAILGAASIAIYGPGRGFLVPEHGASRSLALLLLPMCASGLARWRYGDRRLGPVIFAISLALMAFSLSRATLVIGCVLFALSRFTPRRAGP